jgi:hypothetical protein
MGGMFTVVKVRDDQKPGDYGDPGWFRHPAGTQAYEWKGEVPPAAKAAASAPDAKSLNVRKPDGQRHR